MKAGEALTIADIRIAAGKTQQDIAKEVGVTQGTISHIEQGRIKPSVPLAKKLATVLGCKWTDFFEDAGEEDDSKTKTF